MLPGGGGSPGSILDLLGVVDPCYCSPLSSHRYYPVWDEERHFVPAPHMVSTDTEWVGCGVALLLLSGGEVLALHSDSSDAAPMRMWQ